MYVSKTVPRAAVVLDATLFDDYYVHSTLIFKLMRFVVLLK